ncbi:MAG: peptidoglycan DD-metalloendopeptidase family protein [Candidatus Delongbacteria bacterium]|nr:peptidoglycan DD-metalloendopeptidase family protein [Candidatus Delongbacteria bacterium]
MIRVRILLIIMIAGGLYADEFSKQRQLLDSLEKAILTQKTRIDQVIKSRQDISGKLDQQKRRISVSQKSHHQVLNELNQLNAKLSALKTQAGLATDRTDSIRRELSTILPLYYKATRHYENRRGFPNPQLDHNHQPMVYLRNFSHFYYRRIQSMIDTLSNLQHGIYAVDRTRRVTSDEKIRQTRLQNRLVKEKETLEKTMRDLDQKRDRLTNAYQEKLQDKRKIEQWLTDYEAERKKKGSIPPSLHYSFKALKRKLNWPMPGRILSGYGRQINQQYKTQTFMNGIEIEPGPVRDVSAIAAGIVRFADWHRSYGRFMIIEHSQGYYSIYGYLEKILVAVGQSVTSSQIVGRIGPNGVSSQEKLFFAIYQGDRTLNPLEWLIKRH